MVHRYSVRQSGEAKPRQPADPAALPPPQDTEDFIKCRFVFGVLGVTGIAVLYALRVNLSVAIVTMVNHTAVEALGQLRGGEDAANASVADADADADADACPARAAEAHTEHTGAFAWDEERQGLVLAAFFWGYAAGQLPGGLLAERLGGKRVFGLGVLATAALTLASPLLLRAHELLFVAARFLEGLCEGVTFPAVQAMIARWAPPAERSRFSIIFSGSYLGTVVTLPLSGFLCDVDWLGGWPLVFYVTGALGVAWYVPWQLCVFDSPAQHPRISAEERRFLEHALGGAARGQKPPVPWRRMLASRGLWSCAAMHLGIGWNFFGQITYLPSYMSEILHYNIENNALFSAIPYVLGGASSLASTVVLDWLLTRKVVSPLTGFKIFNGITGVGAAVTLLLLPFAGCNKMLINIILALNGISLGAQYAGNGTNLLILAPNFAGTMYGISNTMANAAGILAPYAVGFLTYENQTRSAWNIMFFISSAIGAGSFIVYLLLCTDKEEPWNNLQVLDEVLTNNNNESVKSSPLDAAFENKAFEPEANK